MPFFLQWIFPFVPQKSFFIFYFNFLLILFYLGKVKHGILTSKDFQNQLIFIRPRLKMQTLNTPLCILMVPSEPSSSPLAPPQRKKRKEKRKKTQRD
jgi:hypothetical protein